MSSSAAFRNSLGSDERATSNACSFSFVAALCSRALCMNTAASALSTASFSALSDASLSFLSADSCATCARRISSCACMACLSASCLSRILSNSLTFSLGFQPNGRTSRATGLIFKPLITTSIFWGIKPLPLIAWTSKLTGIFFFAAKESSIKERIIGGKPPEKRRPSGPTSASVKMKRWIPSSGGDKLSKFTFGAAGGGNKMISSSPASSFFCFFTVGALALLPEPSLLLELLEAFFFDFLSFFFLSPFGLFSSFLRLSTGLRDREWPRRRLVSPYP
mmetsp:Transcript_80507/g.231111  ORF Transcript_80507/g.231111 Transcript_80507/m.231111 type:complete len:278 (-) Transcript_80507:75-908(-)